MSDVKVFKLFSSEELIATIVSSDDQTITIEDPITLAYQPMGDGKMSVGFAPFMPQSTGQIVLQKTAVACTAAPKDALLTEYNRVNSKIITPSKDLFV